MLKKMGFSVLVLILCLFPLMAKGQQDVVVEQDQGQEEVQLRFSWWGGDSRHEATLAAIALFEERHPGVTIEAEYTGWSGHLEKVTTQISGGTAPDLMQINWNWLMVFSRNGDGFYDLNELSDIVDLGNYSEAALDSETINGKLNGLPLAIAGRVMYFNKTTFDKAGVAIPSSFEELVAAGQAFKANLGDDYFPYHLGWEEAWLTMNSYIAQMYGKTFINPVTNEVQITVAEMESALEMYSMLIDNHVAMTIEANASLGADAVYQTPNWIDGRVAGIYQWDSAINKNEGNLAEGQELVIAPDFLNFPGAKNPGLFFKPSMLFCINKDTQHAELAAELLNFLVSDPDAVRILGTTRGTPINSAAEDLLAQEGALTGLPYDGHLLAMEKMGNSLPQSMYFEDASIRDLAKDTIELYGYGRLTTNEAAVRIVEGATSALQMLAN